MQGKPKKELPKMPGQLETMIARTQDPEKAQKLAAAVRLDPLRYFCPNGAQEKVINLFSQSLEDAKLPVLLVTFANGVGKTTITCHILLNLIYGPQNGWFDAPIFRSWPYPKEIWYCSTAEALRNTVQPEIERLIAKNFHPERSVNKTKDGKTIISTMAFKNGWRIVFKTYDQDPDTYESANVGLIVTDEPMPENLFKACKSRRRKGAVMLMPMTPLYTPPYILDEIETAVTENRPGYSHLTASVYDACKRRGIRGHLDADIVDEMVQSYTPEERRARAFGEFMYFSGSIYPELDADVHLVDPEDYPVSGLKHVVKHVVDPHDSRPAASIWMAVDRDNRHIIFAESPTDHTRSYWDMKNQPTIEEEVGTWARIEKRYCPDHLRNHGAKIMRIMDKRFGWQSRGKTTMSELYAHEGYSFIPSYSVQGNEGEIAYGHKVVRSMIQPGADGIPKLLIWNTCQHTWAGLKHYIRKQRTGKSAQDYADGDGTIVEKYKDFPDVVRYGVCTLFLPIAEHDKTEYERFVESVVEDDDMSGSGEFSQFGTEL